MQATSFPVWVAGVASGLAAGAVVLAFSLAWDNHSLRGQLTDSREQLASAAGQVADLRDQQSSTAAELAVQQQQLAALQADLDTLRQNAASEAADPVSPRLARARIFAGGRYLGLGWVQATPAGGAAGDGSAGFATVVADQPVATQPGGSWASSPPQVASAVSFAQAYQYQPYLYTVGWVDGFCPTNREPRPPFSPLPSVDPPPATVTSTTPLPTPAPVANFGATSGRQRLRLNRLPPRAPLPFPNSGMLAGGQRNPSIQMPRQSFGSPAVTANTIAPASNPRSRITPTPIYGRPWQR